MKNNLLSRKQVKFMFSMFSDDGVCIYTKRKIEGRYNSLFYTRTIAVGGVVHLAIIYHKA